MPSPKFASSPRSSSSTIAVRRAFAGPEHNIHTFLEQDVAEHAQQQPERKGQECRDQFSQRSALGRRDRAGGFSLGAPRQRVGPHPPLVGGAGVFACPWAMAHVLRHRRVGGDQHRRVDDVDAVLVGRGEVHVEGCVGGVGHPGHQGHRMDLHLRQLLGQQFGGLQFALFAMISELKLPITCPALALSPNRATMSDQVCV